MVDEGCITVEICQEGEDILFRVTDNGVGMSAQQVEAIMSRSPGEQAGIGIRNVDDRLKIYFGPRYGLRITSEPDVGTCVEIRMPKVRGEDGYEAK